MIICKRPVHQDDVSFPQLEELISPHMCRPKPRINEEKQVVDVFYISGRFAPYDLHSRYKYKIIKGIKRFSRHKNT